MQERVLCLIILARNYYEVEILICIFRDKVCLFRCKKLVFSLPCHAVTVFCLNNVVSVSLYNDVLCREGVLFGTVCQVPAVF